MKKILPIKVVVKRRRITVHITKTWQFNHGNAEPSQPPPPQDWTGRKKSKDLFVELSRTLIVVFNRTFEILESGHGCNLG